MDEKETLSSVVNIVTDKPDILTITAKPENRWQKLLIRLKLKPSTTRYEMYRLKVGNAYRISAAVLQIPQDIIQNGDVHEMHNLLVKHIDVIIYVVAVGLQNNRNEPGKALLNKLRWEFSDSELISAFLYIMQRMDLTSFTTTIALARGLNILDKTSPKENAEIIARSV